MQCFLNHGDIRRASGWNGEPDTGCLGDAILPDLGKIHVPGLFIFAESETCDRNFEENQVLVCGEIGIRIYSRVAVTKKYR